MRDLADIFTPGPRRQTSRHLVRRMADLITRRVTGGGSISRDELLGGGFTPIEIDTHFPTALARSGVRTLGETYD